MTQPAGGHPSPAVQRFPILFTGANRSMRLIGIVPSRGHVDVDETTIHVRMGWAFSARVARSAVTSAAADHERVLGWGAHGWRGTWLVNGSSHGIVRIELDPPGRAYVLGVPVRLQVLRVSVEDPDGLIAELAPSA
jgi:hypothetical protein